MPFRSCKYSTETPYFAAIEDRVSPDSIKWNLASCCKEIPTLLMELEFLLAISFTASEYFNKSEYCLPTNNLSKASSVRDCCNSSSIACFK